MPLRKFCAHPGCNKVIDITKTYCSKHTITKAQRDKEYDAKYRDQKAKAFYNSKAWQIVRQKILTRDNHIDIYLYMTERRIVKAALVHHIVEYREDPSKGLDPDNLISVSEETHEKIIKKMYANEETKKQMQQQLRKAIEDYREFGACGGSKKVFSVLPKTAAPLNFRKNSLNGSFLERRQEEWHDQENR